MKTLKCCGAIMCLFLLLTPLVKAQQLKLGASPNQIEKSALLDLNSDKQGLLLPRVTDFTLAPLNTAPDGMLIFNVPDKLLYVRKNGLWRRLIDETSGGITSVNGITTSAVSLTTNNIPESVNLYYTDARARSAFSAGTGINITGAGVISALNTTALWNASQLRGRNISTTAPVNNDVLTWDNASSTWLPKAAAASGVTSVALSLPSSVFNVTGSPVTSTGTLTGAFASQTARTVFAAPVAANGTPSFRALDAQDIPSLDAAKITSGTLPVSRGGTGTNTIGTAYQFVRVNAAATAYEYYTPTGSDFPGGSPYYIQNISSGTQTANFAINGNGRIGGNFTLSGLTNGSVPFIGTGGLVSQDNANFFWDNTNKRLGIGTATPNNTLEVAGTTAATGVSGLRLKDLNAATVQTSNSKVLSIDNAGNVIVTSNVAGNNWLLTGNTNVAAGSFLGTTDDRIMSIRSNSLPYLEFGRRQTLGLTQNYTDYTNNDEKVTYIRSALQFEVPAVVDFYKPKMWTTADGNFRVKGSSAGSDFFEFGGIGTNNNGGLEFVTGDDGNEPILFKNYNVNGPVTIEAMRVQSGNVGINMNGVGPARNLTVNGNFRFTGSVGISDRLLGRNNTDGDVATIGVGTTLTMSSNVLDANASSAIWNANRIQGVTVASTAPTSGQVMTYNGSSWAPATPAASGATGAVTMPVVSYEDAAAMNRTVNADATMYTIAFRATTWQYQYQAVVNLPRANTCPGRVYLVTNTCLKTNGAYSEVTINTTGGDLMGTLQTIKLYGNTAMQVQSTGTYWIIIFKSSTNIYWNPYGNNNDS